MTQASSSAKNTSSLGAAAAAAATTPAAKPADAKASDAKPVEPSKPAEAPANATAAGAPSGDEGKKKERNGSKVFIAVGAVHEFDSINKAEKFLNAENAPTEYAVLRGKRIGTSKKVSLR